MDTIENPLIDLIDDKDKFEIIKKEDPIVYKEIIDNLDKVYSDSIDNMKNLADILKKLVATGNFPNSPTDDLLVKIYKKINIGDLLIYKKQSFFEQE